MKFIDFYSEAAPPGGNLSDLEGYHAGNDTNTVGFSVNSEEAYNAVMQHFGDYINHDETSGIMYVPAEMWSKVESIAFDADGVGAEQDDGYEQGVAEVSNNTLKSYQQKVSSDSMKHKADPTKRSPEKANRSVAGFAKAQNRLEKGVAEGSAQTYTVLAWKNSTNDSPDVEELDIEAGQARDMAQELKAEGYKVVKIQKQDMAETRIETIHGSAYTIDPNKYYVWAWDNAVVLYGEYTDENDAELNLSKIERRATKRLGPAVKGRFEVASGKMLLRQYGNEQGVAEGFNDTDTVFLTPDTGPLAHLRYNTFKDASPEEHKKAIQHHSKHADRATPQKAAFHDMRAKMHHDWLSGKQGVAEVQINELSPELLKKARDRAGEKWADADDRKDKKASAKYNAQDDKFNSALRKKQKDIDEGVAEGGDSFQSQFDKKNAKVMKPANPVQFVKREINNNCERDGCAPGELNRNILAGIAQQSGLALRDVLRIRNMMDPVMQQGMAEGEDDADEATAADQGAADKNIIMQIRKASDYETPMTLELADGNTAKIDARVAKIILAQFDRLKPVSKELMQQTLNTREGFTELLNYFNEREVAEANDINTIREHMNIVAEAQVRAKALIKSIYGKI